MDSYQGAEDFYQLCKTEWEQRTTNPEDPIEFAEFFKVFTGLFSDD